MGLFSFSPVARVNDTDGSNAQGEVDGEDAGSVMTDAAVAWFAAPAFARDDFQDAGRIGKSEGSLPEIDAMLGDIGLPLGFIPLKSHKITIQKYGWLSRLEIRPGKFVMANRKCAGQQAQPKGVGPEWR
jgi:hypothetical protein